MGKRKSNEQFQREFAQVGTPIDLLSPYVGSTTKIACRCRACGYEWNAVPSVLLRGGGCNKCADKVRSAKRTKTHEQFVSELAAKNPSVEIVGRYAGIKNRIAARCRECGHEWEPVADNLMQGRGCPECGGTRQRTPEEFAALMAQMHPSITCLSPYTRARDRVDCVCGACGYEWSPQAASLISGKGCPSCAGNAKKTNEQFLLDLKQANPDVIPLERYIHSTAPIRVQCAKCGHVWSATPNNLLRLHRCPSCVKAGTSFMEQCLLAGLRMAFGQDAVLSRDRSAIGRELDIFIPEKRVAIEPGSWAWHSGKLARDGAKRKACLKCRIRLITIYDSYPPDEPAPFDADCWTYSIDLGSEEDHGTLRAVLSRIIEELGSGFEVSDSDWFRIEEIAAGKSARRDTERFIAELAEINPGVEVLGQYRKVHEKIAVRCRKCGGEWSPGPNQLLRGQGCPYCTGKKALGGVNDLATLRPDLIPFWDGDKNTGLEPTGIGIGSYKRVWWRCPDCGRGWSGGVRDMCRKAHPCSSCKSRLKPREVNSGI